MARFESEVVSHNVFYYAFSDDLKNMDKSQSIWHASIVPVTPNTALAGYICRCMILDKSSFDPTFCVIDNTHRMYKMSQILNHRETKMLTSFHTDNQKVMPNPKTMIKCVFYLYFCLF